MTDEMEQALKDALSARDTDDLQTFLETAIVVADQQNEPKGRNCKCATGLYLCALNDALRGELALPKEERCGTCSAPLRSRRRSG